MSATAASPPPDQADKLRSLYDTSLEPYLAAQDAQVWATRRNRWLILFGGLALAGAVLYWAVHRDSNSEFPPMVAFALAIGSIGLFAIMKDALAHTVRDHVMAQVAPLLGLQFVAHPGTNFDVDRFALLGLGHCTTVICNDRLSGKIGGLAADMATAKLYDESSSGAGSDSQARTIVRFSGVLMRIEDPLPPPVRFRLIPPASRSPKGMLRGTSITISIDRDPGQPARSSAEMRAMVAATPEEAPVTPTGDTAFDARFELHASAPDVAAALARLDAGTRAALLNIADRFGGGPVSVGFDAGGVLFAFVTEQRFEIGQLRPPMAQFERVRHLADQMGVLDTIAQRLSAAGQKDDPSRPAARISAS